VTQAVRVDNGAKVDIPSTLQLAWYANDKAELQDLAHWRFMRISLRRKFSVPSLQSIGWETP